MVTEKAARGRCDKEEDARIMFANRMTASYKRNNNVVSVLCDSKSYTRDRDGMLS